jgi:hypothetical protein
MLSGVPIQVSTNGVITTINANNTPVLSSNGNTTTLLASNTTAAVITNMPAGGFAMSMGSSPASWNIGGTVLEVSPSQGLSVGYGLGLNLNSNIYYNGSNYYYNSSTTAATLSLAGGQFAFKTAPSGTINTQATVTTQMILTNPGNLGLGGNTSPGNYISIGNSTTSALGAGSSGYITVNKPVDVLPGTTGTRMIDLYAYYPGYLNASPSATINAGVLGATNTTNGFLAFQTLNGGTLNEVVRFDYQGNVFFGRTGGLTGFTGNTSIQIGSGPAFIGATSTGALIGNGATLSFYPGGNRACGFFTVSSVYSSSANIRTQKTYSVFVVDNDNTSIQQIHTADGTGGGSSFTVSYTNGTGFVVTNTSGGSRSIYIAIFATNQG